MKLQFQLNKFQVNFLDTIVFFRNNNNQSKQLFAVLRIQIDTYCYIKKFSS